MDEENDPHREGSPTPGSSAVSGGPSSPTDGAAPRRRRWLRWVGSFVALAVLTLGTAIVITESRVEAAYEARDEVGGCIGGPSATGGLSTPVACIPPPWPPPRWWQFWLDEDDRILSGFPPYQT